MAPIGASADPKRIPRRSTPRKGLQRASKPDTRPHRRPGTDVGEKSRRPRVGPRPPGRKAAERQVARTEKNRARGGGKQPIRNPPNARPTVFRQLRRRNSVLRPGRPQKSPAGAWSQRGRTPCSGPLHSGMVPSAADGTPQRKRAPRQALHRSVAEIGSELEAQLDVQGVGIDA